MTLLLRSAKTDRADARHLRTLLCEGRLPEAWIPPEYVRRWRTRTRLRKTLVDERTAWLQRIQATLFHHGVSGTPDKLLSERGRAFGRRAPPATRRPRADRGGRCGWSRESMPSSLCWSASCAGSPAASRAVGR